MPQDQQQEGLLAGQGNDTDRKAARGIVVTWCLFAACFSSVLCTVIACIPLAASSFGPDLGNYFTGTFYATYAVTGMLVTAPLTQLLGARLSMIVGLALYSTYSIAYLIGRQVGPHGPHPTGSDWPARGVVLMIGAFTSGVGAGLVWPGQQAYFVKCAERHSQLLQIDQAVSKQKFSSYFAMIFLSIELFTKLLSTFMQLWVCINDWDGIFISGSCTNGDLKNKGQITVFAIYVAMAVVATALTVLVPMKIDEEQKEVAARPPLMQKSVQAMRLMVSDPKVLLMAGIIFAFSATATLLNSYVMSEVVAPGVGATNIGLFAAIIPLTAAVAQPVMAKLSDCINSKMPAVIFGMLCFFFYAFPFLIEDDPAGKLGKWGVLVPMYVMFGIGRAVYEGPNKAIWSEFFTGEQGLAAGSNIFFQNGIMTTICFYAFPHMTAKAKATMCAAVSAWAIVGFVLAKLYHRRQLRQDNENTSVPAEVDA